MAVTLHAAAIQQRGAVTSVAAAPSGRAGQQIAVDVKGTNPCGAVNIDYGDGTAITYATDALPITKGHTYEYGGTYTIKATGMGNCDRTATTQITISGPPRPAAPPPLSGKVTSLDIQPQSGVVREPVKIVINGSDSCAFDVDFGDGNRQHVSGALPQSVEHTYSVADTYTVAVNAASPCSGRFTQALQISDRAAAHAGVTRLDVSPTPTRRGRRTSIVVYGNGSCRVNVDFGDGGNVVLTGAFPQRIFHTYVDSGTIYVSAWPDDPCDGYADAQLVVR
jgi:PKD repeat protein